MAPGEPLEQPEALRTPLWKGADPARPYALRKGRYGHPLHRAIGSSRQALSPGPHGAPPAAQDDPPEGSLILDAMMAQRSLSARTLTAMP